MEKKLRIGLIGIGGMGSHHLFTSHAENPRVQIVAFCDLIEERCTNAICCPASTESPFTRISAR